MPICDCCWVEIATLSGAACACCGDAVDDVPPDAGPGARTAVLCRMCRLAPPPFVRAVAYGPYRGRMKDAIHALKYDRLHPAAHRLGPLLALAMAQLAAEAPQQLLVVPVPLHPSKYAQRGFNQARELAREALASLSRTHPEWRLTLAPSALMRLRATESQAGLSPRQRRLNVRGAFSVNDPVAVTGKHILLVDDILTTGATARAAARALKRAGAQSVYVASLARARREQASRRGFAGHAERQSSLAGAELDASAVNVSGQTLH